MTELEPRQQRLRIWTWLAPSLPIELFETVASYLSASLGVAVGVHSETATSAPPPGAVDPFTRDEADLGFLCAPGWIWLSELNPPSVELVPAAFVFDDPRNGDRPVYFSDVVVAADSSHRAFADLAGTTWGFNDRCSLSGYFAVVHELARRGADLSYFGGVVDVGSHLRALQTVAGGVVGCAAVDSNVLRQALRDDPGLAARIRIVATLGPHPVQPIVARAGLPADWRGRIAATLLAMHRDEIWCRRLAALGVRRLAPIDADEFVLERETLRAATACAATRGAAP